jgi:hypothetical protein
MASTMAARKFGPGEIVMVSSVMSVLPPALVILDAGLLSVAAPGLGHFPFSTHCFAPWAAFFLRYAALDFVWQPELSVSSTKQEAASVSGLAQTNGT